MQLAEIRAAKEELEVREKELRDSNKLLYIDR